MSLPTNNKTLNQLMGMFRNISERHPQINDFGYEPLDQITNTRDIKYPLMWVNVRDDSQMIATENGGFSHIQFNLSISILDKLIDIDVNNDRMGEEDDNGLEVSSDTLQIVNDIVAEISGHRWYRSFGINLKSDISFSPYYEYEDDDTNGWSFDFMLTFPFRLVSCGTPLSAPNLQIPGSSQTEYPLGIPATRPPGEDGPAGEDGPIGATGPQGIQGIQGEIGPTGSFDGNSFQILSGTISGASFSGTPLVYDITLSTPINNYIVTAESDTQIDFTITNKNSTGFRLESNTNTPFNDVVTWQSTQLVNDLVGAIKGDKGDQGIQGVTGSQGIQGEVEPTGSQGIQGIQGIQGEVEPTGSQGIQGIQGEQGEQGEQGVQGIQGIQGPKGDKGDQGVQGIQGIQGEVGPTGSQGIQGEVGPTGSQGIQGEQGIQGIQGIQGEVGPTGSQGIQGIQGEVGPTGSQGIQGIQGPTGSQGIQGETGTFSGGTFQIISGTISGLSFSGTPLVYDITLSNSITDYIVNVDSDTPRDFTITNKNSNGFRLETNSNTPFTETVYWQSIEMVNDLVGALKGDQGIQGEQGIQGVTGSQGIQGETGPTGSQGEQGIQGIQGVTGSQGIQGEVGPTGSQGEQGIQGVTGSQGIQGEVGPTGSQGIQGIQGIQGEIGPTGSQGEQGLQGIQGEQGPQGIQGIQGVKGDKGDQGIQGVTGSQGIQGIQGEVGPTGSQGIQGVTGSYFESTLDTGTLITFTDPKIYNSPTSPGTASITQDLTESGLGYIQKIYHNHSVAPSVPAGWVLLSTEDYVTSQLNIIYAEWVSGTRVEYWVVVEN